MRTDIVIHNVASLRIDPAVLVRPDRRLALIASPGNRQRLRQRGRDDAFNIIVTIDSFDFETLAAAVRGIVADLPPRDRADVALLCHDEYSLGVVARVRRELAIEGDTPANVAPFVDKLAMKRALRHAGVRVPRHLPWDPAASRETPDDYLARVVATVGLPAFVKPTNESGCVGARRVDTATDLAAWAVQRSQDPPGSWEIDEYIAGTLYHVDSMVCDGEIVHAGVNEDIYPCYDYVDGKINGSFTIPASHPAHDKLLAFNQRVLRALEDKPSRGVFHHEIFERPDGELVFLEIAARAPAALIPFTSQIRYGINIEEALFALQRGECPTPPARRGPFAAYVYFPKPAGVVIERHQPDIDSDHRWIYNVEIGDVLAAATDIRDFAASVLLWNDDFDALKEDLHRLDKHRPVSVA